jgi:hypothetical protein
MIVPLMVNFKAAKEGFLARWDINNSAIFILEKLKKHRELVKGMMKGKFQELEEV